MCLPIGYFGILYVIFDTLLTNSSLCRGLETPYNKDCFSNVPYTMFLSKLFTFAYFAVESKSKRKHLRYQRKFIYAWQRNQNYANNTNNKKQQLFQIGVLTDNTETCFYKKNFSLWQVALKENFDHWHLSLFRP